MATKSLKRYRIEKETQEVACTAYKNILKRECEDIGVFLKDSQYALEYPVTPSLVDDAGLSHHEKMEFKKHFNLLLNETMNAISTIKLDPIQYTLLRIAKLIANDILEKTNLDIAELTYDLVKGLINKYAPEIDMKNVIHVLFVLSKVVKYSIMGYNLVQCGNPVMCGFTMMFVRDELCSMVSYMGGWEVCLTRIGFGPKEVKDNCRSLATKNENTVNIPNSKPLMIAGILGGIACVALLVGKAVIDNKNNRGK